MNNVEMYTLSSLNEHWSVYKKYLKDNKYKDIDYPNLQFKLDITDLNELKLDKKD